MPDINVRYADTDAVSMAELDVRRAFVAIEAMTTANTTTRSKLATSTVTMPP